MIVEGKRKTQFQVWKKRGDKKLYLILKVKPSPCNMFTNWHIPQEHEGKLAITPPSWKDCYNISWRDISPKNQKAFLKCIQYIEKNGTPMENDENIFPCF